MSGERGRFVEHAGRRMYVIDFFGLSAEQIVALLPPLGADIRSQPPGSVLTVTRLQGVVVSKVLLDRLKEFITANRPYVKAGVLVGLSPFQRAMAMIASIATGRSFHLADSIEEALDLLARGDPR